MLTDDERAARAAALLDVPASEIGAFNDDDTFNGNRIAGFICRRADHRYGALVIDRVNEADTEPQRVYCTPKVHYPFGRTPDEERRYYWPKAIRRVEVYDKLDGTNICAYSYADAAGARFVTFKTRLTATLRPSAYGDFSAMWREILAAHPTMRQPFHVLCGDVSLSFEMYGYRNPHLIAYAEPLAASLLFAVGQIDATIIPPSDDLLRLLPTALRPVHVATGADDLTALYDAHRADGDARNRRTDGEQVDGTEGWIFYTLDGDGRWSQWKCKPESIEALHWVSDFLPEPVVTNTAWNALESCDGSLTADYVATLLREEFTQTQVSKSWPRIEKAVAFVTQRAALRALVRERYEATGLRFDTDGRGAVMRALAPHFDRGQMRDVYGALRELGIAA